MLKNVNKQYDDTLGRHMSRLSATERVDRGDFKYHWIGTAVNDRYSIPAEKRVHDIWIDRIGNQKLVGEENPRLLSYYGVCDTHFAKICRERPGKLKKFALPTLNLPEYYNEESTEENCFSFPSAQEYATPRKIKDKARAFQVVKYSPATSVESRELKMLIPQKVYQPPSKKIKHCEDYPDRDCLTDTFDVTVLPETPSPTMEKIPKHLAMAPKLYKTDHSPSSRTVMLAAKHMGIELDYIEISLAAKDHLKPNFVKMNPQHTIPTLDDDGKIIWDSHAIVLYLATKYSKGESLYPKEPYKRAVVDQRLHFDTGVLFAPLKGLVNAMRDRGEKIIPNHVIEQINEAYGFVNKFLEGHKWVAGDDITFADFCILTSITSLDCAIPINNNKYPNVIAWIKRAELLPCYDINKKGLEDFRVFFKKIMS